MKPIDRRRSLATFMDDTPHDHEALTRGQIIDVFNRAYREFEDAARESGRAAALAEHEIAIPPENTLVIVPPELFVEYLYAEVCHECLIAACERFEATCVDGHTARECQGAFVVMLTKVLPGQWPEIEEAIARIEKEAADARTVH